jgi:hypothetical protein
MRHVRKSDLGRRFSRHAEIYSAAFYRSKVSAPGANMASSGGHDAAFENLRARGYVDKPIGQSVNWCGFRFFESDFVALP